MPKNTVRRKPSNSKTRNYAGRVGGRKRGFLSVSRESALRFLVFAAFSGVLAVLVSPTVTLAPNLPTRADYGTPEQPGYAKRRIQAEIEFPAVDLALTDQARRASAEEVLPVYAFDRDALSNTLLEVGKFLEILLDARKMTALTFDAKLALLGGVIIWPSVRLWLLVGVMVLGSVGSHMPKRYRHYSFRHGRVVD